MKKTLTLSLLAAALAVTAPAFAQSAKFEGFSVAAGLGFGGSNTSVGLGTPAVPATDIDPEEPATNNVLNFGKTNNVAVFDLAYGKRLNQNIVLGVGATLDLGKSQAGGFNITQEVMSGDLKFVGKNHFSIYAQPTWVLTPDTGVFFKLGYHKMKGSAEGLLGSALPFGTQSLSGLGYGIGVKSYISKNMFIQAEATTIGYKSKSLSVPSDNADLMPSLNLKVKSTVGIVSIGMNF